MALSLSIPVNTTLHKLNYKFEAPMGSPEYTACSCGYPVKSCICSVSSMHGIKEFLQSPSAMDAANTFANGASFTNDPFYAPEVEEEAGRAVDKAYAAWIALKEQEAEMKVTTKECPNCGLFECGCVFDDYESMYSYNYCYSCKGDCTQCDCQDFAQALLSHSSTASHSSTTSYSVSSFNALQKAYESMGLLPATGWAAHVSMDAQCIGVPCNKCQFPMETCECKYPASLCTDCVRPTEMCDCIPLCQDCRFLRPHCICHPPCSGCTLHPQYCECPDQKLADQELTDQELTDQELPIKSKYNW
jgi:hypothetical protein